MRYDIAIMTFVAKLLAPSIFIPAILIGILVNRWWALIIAAIVFSLLSEVYLASIRPSQTFDFSSVIIGFFAATALSLMTLAARRYFPGRRVD